MADTDAAQVALVLGGDPDAFRVLVERHGRRLYRLAYRMTSNEHDAEEIVQDALLKAYRSLERFESRSNFGTWVYRICANCALDRMRKQKAEDTRRERPAANAEEGTPDAMETAPSADPGPDRLAISGEVGAGVKMAMQSLSATERAAFVLRHVDGSSIEEIAETLDLSIGATKNTVFRAVQKLRKQLEPMVAAR
jgi:RNA polymerase sigma-70 factor, ECF subfamily